MFTNFPKSAPGSRVQRERKREPPCLAPRPLTVDLESGDAQAFNGFRPKTNLVLALNEHPQSLSSSTKTQLYLKPNIHMSNHITNESST